MKTKFQKRKLSESQNEKLQERVETIGKKLIGELDHETGK